MLRRGFPRLAIVALVGVACSSAGAEPPVTTAPVSATTIATTTTAAPTTTEEAVTSTTAAPDAAPPELAGSWRTVISAGDSVGLSLNGTQYTVSRGSAGGFGKISVEGDQITFYGSNLCDGVGTYQWSVEGNSLTFTAAEPVDPCGGRRPILDGITYTR